MINNNKVRDFKTINIDMMNRDYLGATKNFSNSSNDTSTCDTLPQYWSIS